jgi:hypothetical protein
MLLTIVTAIFTFYLHSNESVSFMLGKFFLLSMNEVNIKYWFRDFQKNFLIDFLDEWGLFIGEKLIFTKKLSTRFLKDALKLETYPLESLKELVQLELVSFFDLKNKIRRVAAIQIVGSFFTSTWNIDQFKCFWLDLM